MFRGGMAERLKAAVLKTAGRRRPAGSNPAPSASLGSLYGEVAEPAEGNRLLSGCTGKTVPRVRIPPSPPSFLERVFREGMSVRRGVRAGRRNATGNRVGGLYPPRGFESLPLRHPPSL